MRETCYEVLEALGLHDDRLFKLAMALEKIALEDDYFVKRKLYPNVDFYSGIVQRAIGIPVSLFTAHLRAGADGRLDRPVERDDLGSDQKIGRPRQLYTGAIRRDVSAAGDALEPSVRLGFVDSRPNLQVTP